MAEEKLRLGGMALANGVLVHGPTAWACAVRTPSGTLKVASGSKPRVAVSSELPLLRGPARLIEAVLVLPRVRRALDLIRELCEQKRITIALDVPPDLTVTAEADSLVQILANLLRNAAQAVGAGSSIGVRRDAGRTVFGIEIPPPEPVRPYGEARP